MTRPRPGQLWRNRTTQALWLVTRVDERGVVAVLLGVLGGTAPGWAHPSIGIEVELTSSRRVMPGYLLLDDV